jgi:hypothetical protein
MPQLSAPFCFNNFNFNRYLNITVHSIRCHFDAVVVAVSHPLDEQYVLHQSGLPIHDVIMHTKLPRPSSTGMFTILRIQVGGGREGVALRSLTPSSLP